MSDRTIAGLVMAATAAYCWWLAYRYFTDGEIVSRYGTFVTRRDHPRRFWAATILTALIGLLPCTLALAAFLPLHARPAKAAVRP